MSIAFLKPGIYSCQPFRRKGNSRMSHLSLSIENFAMVEIEANHEHGLVEITYSGKNYLYRGGKPYKLDNPGVSLIVESSQLLMDERLERLPILRYATYVYKNPESGLYEEYYERKPKIDHIRTVESNFEKIYIVGEEVVTLEDLILAEDDDSKNNVILKEIAKRTGLKIASYYTDRDNGSLSGHVLEMRGAFVADIKIKDLEKFKKEFEDLCEKHSVFPDLDLQFNDTYVEDSTDLDPPALLSLALNMKIDLEKLFKQKRGTLIGNKFGL